MHIVFSGTTSTESLPEVVLKDMNKGKGPAIMLTYHEIHEKRGDAKRRLERHVERCGRKPKKKRKRKKKNGSKSKS